MITVAELKTRGCRYGTPGESWKALRHLADCLEAGELPPEHVRVWFAAAIRNPDAKTIDGLGRALGVVAQGRRRVVNKFDVYNRMSELINGGMVKEHAALQVAKEFACSRATALHWYRLKGGKK